MNQPLIIGLGHAGLRHDKLLQARGFNPTLVEPDISRIPSPGYPARRWYKNLPSALDCEKYSCAVICTPPALHLEQITLCLDYDIPILCEKPLCDFGQLDKARALKERYSNIDKQVMVAFNYVWNPDLDRNWLAYLKPSRGIRLYASCHRELPSWGSVMLDNMPHNFSTLSYRFGGLSVDTAREYETPVKRKAVAYGQFVDVPGWFEIRDEVRKHESPRIAYVTDGEKIIQLTANPSMFTRMYDHFLRTIATGEPFMPSFNDALTTQEYLEDAHFYATEGARRDILSEAA